MLSKYQILCFALSSSLIHASSDLTTRVAELEARMNQVEVKNSRNTYGAKNADNRPQLKEPKNLSLGIGLNYQKVFLTDNAYGYLSSGAESASGSNSNTKYLNWVNIDPHFNKGINYQDYKVNSQSLNLDYSGDGELIEPSFSASLGINANIGYKTALDGVEIKASFSNFKTSSTRSYRAEDKDLFYFGTPFTSITGPAYFSPVQYFDLSRQYEFFYNFYGGFNEGLTSIYPKREQRFSINPETSNLIPVDQLKINSDFDYNLLSLELAKAYFVSSKISFEASLGLISGWFNSKTRLTFSDGRDFSPFTMQYDSVYDNVDHRDGVPPHFLPNHEYVFNGAHQFYSFI